MITVKSIDGNNGSRKPEYIPESTIVGSFSDDLNFYFFETKEEEDVFLSELPVPNPVIDYEALVDERIATGNKIMRAYLSDNAAINLTFNQSVEQLQKFQVVKAFLEVGNLEDAKVLVQGIATDGVFTEQRKQKYIDMFP